VPNARSSRRSGLERVLGQPLVVDWLPPYLGWDDAVEFHLRRWGAAAGTRSLQWSSTTGEIVSAHWLTAAEAAQRLSPLAARRLLWIDEARPDDTTYFEEGRPLG